MIIEIDDIKNLETLSRLKMSDQNRANLLGEISSIIEYVGQINDLDLGVVDNSAMLHAHKNVVRIDCIALGISELQRNTILENAPNRQGDFIKVKQVIKK